MKTKTGIILTLACVGVLAFSSAFVGKASATGMIYTEWGNGGPGWDSCCGIGLTSTSGTSHIFTAWWEIWTYGPVFTWGTSSNGYYGTFAAVYMSWFINYGSALECDWMPAGYVATPGWSPSAWGVYSVPPQSTSGWPVI